MNKYFKSIGNTEKISEWKSKGLPDELVKPPANNKLAREVSYVGTKTRVEFNGSYFKQDTLIFSHGTIVNIYTVYELS